MENEANLSIQKKASTSMIKGEEAVTPFRRALLKATNLADIDTDPEECKPKVCGRIKQWRRKTPGSFVEEDYAQIEKFVATRQEKTANFIRKLQKEEKETGKDLLSQYARPSATVNLPETDDLEVEKIRCGISRLSKDFIMDRHRIGADTIKQDALMEFYQALDRHAERCPAGISEEYFNYANQKLRSKEWALLSSVDKYIDWSSVKKVREDPTIHPHIKELITSEMWFRLSPDSDDKYFYRIPILVIFNYVMKKAWARQTLIVLHHYDEDGTGYLTEEWFAKYLTDMIDTCQGLDVLDKRLLSYYLCHVTRRFFFFLDPKNLGKVKISDIITSAMMDDILELREEEISKTNWFSHANFLRLYQHFQSLVGKDGLLSVDKLLKFNFTINESYPAIQITKTFSRALFSKKMTYEGELDFREFVNFVLAVENRRQPQSVSYFFDIFDLDANGYITSFNIHYFYKEIREHLSAMNPQIQFAKFEDINDEIFDMVKPTEPDKITLRDLIKCGKAEHVISMLVDAKGFDGIENQEANPPSEDPSTAQTLPLCKKVSPPLELQEI